MALKRVSDNVQLLITASVHIHSFSKAVEELVYNSLDANATSIAIRICVQEFTIQVLDNGHGMSRDDLKLVGPKYISSKIKLDTNTNNHKHGIRSLSLASIIGISQCVTIISRGINSDDTWLKTFLNGKEENIRKTVVRPSKGTTVDIKGFLYNLHIQRKSVNPITEIENIKNFLKRLSLANPNLSLSLRDDSINKIEFKVHKNRDLYQTLDSLFNIQITKIQEVQVEKHQYKIKAFIEKSGTDLEKYHWIYVNGRFITDSRLYQVVNKYFGMSDKHKITKTVKENCKHESKMFHKKIPTYFIFIICPRHDYDIINSGYETLVEFRDWDSIYKIIEKLLKFYGGELEVKLVSKTECNKIENKDTRKEVKEIMQKILGKSKKFKISQMQNGVKGKNIKRKTKVKPKIQSKLTKQRKINNCNERKTQSMLNEQKKYDISEVSHIDGLTKYENIKSQKVKTNKNIEDISLLKTDRREDISKISLEKQRKKNSPHEILHLNIMHKQQSTPMDTEKNKVNRNVEDEKFPTNNKRKLKKLHKNRHSTKKVDYSFSNDPIIRKFKEPTESVKQRCALLAIDAQKVLQVNDYKIHKKCKPTINHNEGYQHLSIRHTTEHKITHYGKSNFRGVEKENYSNDYENHIKCKTIYDLLKPLHISQIITDHFAYNENIQKNKLPNASILKDDVVESNIHKLTYESHNYFNARKSNNYNTHEYYNYESHGRRKTNYETQDKRQTVRRFISAKSCSNFLLNNKNIQLKKPLHKGYFKRKIKFNDEKYSKPYWKTLFNNFNNYHSSYTIEENNSDLYINYDAANTSFNLYKNQDFYNSTHYTFNFNFENTFNIETLRKKPTYVYDTNRQNMCTINEYTKSDIDHEINKIGLPGYNDVDKKDVNIVFVSETQNQCNDVNPLNVCEIVHSNDINVAEDKFNLINTKNRMEFNKDLRNNSEISQYFSKDFTNDLPNKSDPLNIEIEEHRNTLSADLKRQSIPLDYDGDIGFDLTNRLNFVPKGMSQIIGRKTVKRNDQDLIEEYFEDNIYNKFMSNIQKYSDVLQPVVQNVNSNTTKNMGNFNDKFNKVNLDWIFDSETLRNAKVLNQVDLKFIACKVIGKTSEGTRSEFLVLFDQHAVDERIRLENNLLGYNDGTVWKSVSLDSIPLKFSEDNLLYLHNHSEKFTRFGLQWTLQDGGILVSAIPQAILGKNPRQVDIVIKAVKHFILEQIEAIKLLKGNVSLYPKSIMDLVCSEACRYAVKFGDKLTKSECNNMVRSLANCKMPFQCAHGRPVMAVMMELPTNLNNYKVHSSSIMKIRSLLKLY